MQLLRNMVYTVFLDRFCLESISTMMTCMVSLALLYKHKYSICPFSCNKCLHGMHQSSALLLLFPQCHLAYITHIYHHIFVPYVHIENISHIYNHVDATHVLFILNALFATAIVIVTLYKDYDRHCFPYCFKL
jgi:hypothetical protein